MLSLIAAMAHHQVIGYNGQIPWHLPADFAHLKQITLGKPIIMGRKTYESIGRPLPGRRNIVISSQKNLNIPGCDTFTSLAAALEATADDPEKVIFGGSILYKAAMPLVEKMYLTLIDLETEGDTFFPDWDENDWHIVSRESHPADAANPHPYQFLELNSRTPG